MLSDEERKIETLKKYINSQEQKMNDYYKIDEEFYKDEIEQLEFSIKLLRYILNLIEKKSKEIEELKEERKSYAEEYIYNNPWLYKQLNENYILRVESEQKERKAYIKGTNDAHELCNKKWEDETKAKIEELENYYRELYKQDNSPNEFLIGQDCLSKLSILQEVKQSLLEKE